MKKLRLLIIPILAVLLSVNVLALSSNGNTFVFDDKVVTFEATSTLTAEKQQMVEERIVYGAPEDDGVSTYAWCWLTGHDYEYNTVSVITHKKSAYSPRCYMENYNVETCTKCDHMSEEYIGAVYIVCCPEE